MSEKTERYREWAGTVTYEDTVFRVSVITPGDHWDSEIKSAISKAGGRNTNVRETGTTNTLPTIIPPEGTEYIVTFTPDPALTKDSGKRKPVTVFLSSKFSRLEHGQLQDWARYFDFKSRRTVRCPKCGDPGYRGSICKNPKCRMVLY